MQLDGPTLIQIALGISLIGISFCGLLALHREHQNQQALVNLLHEALLAMTARRPQDIAEAKAISAYETEAVRQYRISFDSARKDKTPAPVKPTPEPLTAVDSHGNVFEVITGLE